MGMQVAMPLSVYMCFASAHLSANMDKISSLTTLVLWHIDVYTHVTQLFP